MSKNIFYGIAKDYPFLSYINQSIKIDYHEHPLIFCTTPERCKQGSSWTCNKCFLNYSYDTPSFYCTFCDFDLCQNCLSKYKLNQINLYEKNINSNIPQKSNNNFQWQKMSPHHIHLLTLIQKRNKNFSWKCDICSHNYGNINLSFYCSLCDYYICPNCFLINSNSNNNINNEVKNNISESIGSLNSYQQNQNNIFQIESFKVLNQKEQNKNLLYCPLSVQLLFTLISNGISEENTLNELKLVFNIQNLEEENNYYINFLSSILNYESLNMANSIYSIYDPSFHFKEWLTKYKTIISKDVTELNKFIEKNTNNKVKDYFKDIDFNSIFILVNVLYFKSKWKFEFNPCDNKMPFYKSNGQISQVDMMYREEEYNYYEDESIQAIEIKYICDNMSALILFPNKSISIDNLIKSLSQDKLNILYSKLNFKKVKLTMPKFKFDDKKKKINLTPMLKMMGINKVFEKTKTNFKLLTGDDKLFGIDEICQTNLLNVNEKETEFISITSMMTFGSVSLPKNMTVNRPFLFIIRNDKFKIGKDLILISKIEDL